MSLRPNINFQQHFTFEPAVYDDLTVCPYTSSRAVGFSGRHHFRIGEYEASQSIMVSWTIRFMPCEEHISKLDKVVAELRRMQALMAAERMAPGDNGALPEIDAKEVRG